MKKITFLHNTLFSAFTSYQYILKQKSFKHTYKIILVFFCFLFHTPTIKAQDVTAPVFENSTPNVSNITATSFTLNTDLDEAGTVFYLLSSSPPPRGGVSAANVVAGTATGVVATGNIAVSGGGFTNSINVTGLSLIEGTSYRLYVVAQDDESSPNLQSSSRTVSFTVAIPPIFENNTPTVIRIQNNMVTFKVDLNEASKIYAVMIPDGATAPTSAQVKLGQNASSVPAFKATNVEVTTGFFSDFIDIGGLTPATAYDMYVVAEDNISPLSLQTSPTKIDVNNDDVYTLISNSPADNATNVSISSNIVLTFSEEVRLGTGNIIIKKTSDNSTVETIAVTSGSVTSTSVDNYVTINPSSDFDSNTEYYVQIDNNAFKDGSGNFYAGISDTTSLSFTTEDIANPTLSSSNPADDATGIATNSDIVLTFNENIQFGTGFFQLKQTSNDAAVFSIDAANPTATSNVASISGATLTINPGASLSTSTGYYIFIHSGTPFLDLAGNDFVGLTASTDLNFTTVVPNSVPTDIALSPLTKGQSTLGVNATFGTLSTTDADVSDTHVYSLVSGSGDTDNLNFNISGSTLRTNGGLITGTHNIRVNTFDGIANFVKALTVAVTDDFDPTVTSVSIPNAAAKVGDAITVTIIGGESGLSLNTGQVNGVNVTGFTNTSGNTYTATYTVAEGNTDRAAGDNIPINFILSDGAGNNSLAFTTAISQAADPIDANTPTITSVSIPNASAKVGDAVTVTIIAGEPLLSLNTGQVNGVNVTGFNRLSNTYTVTYTVVEGDTDRAAGDNIPVNFILSDAAGNNSSSFTTAISQASDPIDANTPTITSVSIPNAAAIVGDAITVTIVAGETGLSLNSGSINGGQVTGFSDDGGGSYSATYTVAEGHRDQAAGDDIRVNFILSDAVGNNSLPFRTDISQASDPIDANSPTLNSAGSIPIDNATGISKTADIVLDFSENIQPGSGNIILYDVTNNADVESWNIFSADGGTSPANGSISIGGGGDKLYINPTNTLSKSNVYAIKIPATAIKDVNNNFFAGITDNTTFNFTTEATNSTPTDISISPTTKGQSSLGVNATFGTLSTTDADGSDTHVYTLVAGTGDTDNGNFNISDSTLRTNGGLITGTHNIRVNTFDGTDNFPKALTVTVTDDFDPTFNSAGSTPTDNATSIAIANDIVVDFNEDIAKGTGNITLRSVTGSSNTEVFDITTATATASPTAGNVGILNDKLYINPTSDLSDSNEYAIQIDATAIDDIAGNSFAGITDNTTLDFTTADVTAPSFDATPTASSITGTTLTLNADINETGSIFYVVLLDGATAPTSTEVIAGTGNGGSGQVTSGNASGAFSGTDHNFNVTGLTSETAYDIYLVGTDPSNNRDLNPTKVDATTTDVTNPTLSSSNPADDATGISTNSDIVLTFNENIAFGTGNIEVIDVTDGSNSFTIDANAPGLQASISGTVLTINPSSNIDDSSNYAIQIGSSAITDIIGNSFAGITNNTTLDFNTVDLSAPTFDSTPSISNLTDISFTLTVDLNEGGTIYYVLVANGDAAPTSANVQNGDGSGKAAALFSGNAVVNTVPFSNNFSVIGLTAGTAYDIYVVAQDGSSNEQATPTKIDVTTKYNTWTGTINSDWANKNNWSSGLVPLSTSNIIIPNVTTKPIISANIIGVAKNITIDANSSLTISTGASLTINGDLIQNGLLNINSDATTNGSLIVKGTATGNVTYKRYLITSGVATEGWHLIGAPVNGQDINGFSGSLLTSGSNNKSIATYNNAVVSASRWSYYTTNTIVGAGNFLKAKGYTVKKATDGSLDFTGTLNVNDAGETILLSDGGDDPAGNRWNLIANPYTAALHGNNAADATNNFLKVNNDAGNLDPARAGLYLWNGAPPYVVKSLDDAAFYIAPGQAFFVHAKDASTSSASFTEAMQTHQTGNIFLRNSTSYPEAILQISDGANTSSTKIRYIENKTTGLDPGSDVGTFTGVNSSFKVFTHLVSNSEGINFAIQALPNTNYENMIVPVGVNAQSGTEITFSLNTADFSSDLKMFLEDRLTNVFTRLDQVDNEYKVTAADDLNGIGRFYMHTTSNVLNVDTSESLENISIYKLDNSKLRITGLSQGDASVKIFTILGKKVVNTSFTANGSLQDISLPELVKGVYLVKLQTDKGKLIKKIILE